MKKYQILLTLSAIDKKSRLLNQTIIFTEDYKIFAVFSQEQLDSITSLYELGFDNSETQNLLPAHSETDVMEINCDPNTNPALYLMFMDSSDLYSIKAKMEKDLGKILGIEAKKAYLFNTLFPYPTDFEKDITENPVQDSEIPDDIEFNENPFCCCCNNLEPFTPTKELYFGEDYCLECCSNYSWLKEKDLTPREQLAVKRKRLELQMDLHYKEGGRLEIELEDMPKDK